MAAPVEAVAVAGVEPEVITRGKAEEGEEGEEAAEGDKKKEKEKKKEAGERRRVVC